MMNIFKTIIIFSFLFFSAAIAKNCTRDSECGNVPYAICSAPVVGCSTTVSGIAIDAYPLIYFATICPANNGGSVITFKSIPKEGGIPTDKYSISIPETTSTLTVLDGLFNSIYFKTRVGGPLQRVIAGQVYPVTNVINFGGHINLERDPAGVTTTCGSTGNRDSIDLYGGLRENFMSFAGSIFYLPAGTCGASRIRPRVDGKTSTDLFFTTIISGVTNFYRGLGTCVNCPLPSLHFSVNEIINDFDLSPQYIFFGSSSGLYRTDLNGKNKVRLTKDKVSGVRIRDDKQYNDGNYNIVYFNIGSSIRSIFANGTNNVRLDQQINPQSICQCRGRFSGDNCDQCDGEVQWNGGIPSCK